MEAKLIINLTDENGQGLANKIILVQIKDKLYNVTTNDKGIAIFKYSAAAGNYDVLLSVYDDDTYYASNASTKITIKKASTKIKAPSVRSYLTCSTYVIVNLTDSKGRALAAKHVYLVISGKTYTGITNRKGVAKIKVPTTIGNFNIKVNFDGDENYSSSSIITKLKITKMKTSLIVPAVNSIITKNTYLKIVLKNVFGVRLANKIVSVTIGKKTYNLRTDKTGLAKLLFAKKLGTFKCTVKFKADDKFAASINTSKVVISKCPTLINAPKISFNSSQYGVLKIVLSNIHGNPLKRTPLIVGIPDVKKVFKVKTNDNGLAVLKVNCPKSYDIVVKYVGNKKYKPKAIWSKLVVKREMVKFNDVLEVAEILRNYISKKKSLPSNVKYKNYNFTTAQFSYLMAMAINHIPSNNKNDIVLIGALAPKKQSGEIYDTVYKDDFLKIAKKLTGSYINHRNPGYVKHSFYDVPYKVYTAAFSGILNFYRDNKKLPNYSLFTMADFVKIKNTGKYTFYLTSDNIAGKKSDLNMLKRLANALKSKGYQAIIVGIGPDIHNKAYRYGCTGENSVLLCCFGGVDVGCIEEWAGDLSVGDGVFVNNYNGAHVLGLWYSKPYGASTSLNSKVGIAWDADYGHPLSNPAEYMSQNKISYIETGTISSACALLKEGKMGGPKLIR